MYAIIRTGGKQYKVAPGDVIRVEKLDQKLGSEFKIEDVLFVGGDKAHFGTPNVDKASVSVVVTAQEKGKKILVFKKKRRQGYRRTQGHRQNYTELFVKEVSGPDGSEQAKKEAKVKEPKKAPEKKVAKKKEAGKKATATKKKATAKKTTKKKAASKKKTTAKKKTKAKKKTTTKKTATKKKTKKKS